MVHVRIGQNTGFAVVRKFFIFLLISTVGMISACSDDDETSSKQLKFEIAGTFTGQLSVVIAQTDTNNGNSNQTYTVTSLPWTMTIDFPSNTAAVALAVTSVADKPGKEGESVSATIYKGSKIVQARAVDTNTNGAVNIPGFVYQF